MSIVGIPGISVPFISEGMKNLSNAHSTSTNVGLLDATGEKWAMVGRVWFPERAGTKDIRKVGFKFGGTVTKSGGSGLTVSLQNVSTSAGPPMVPDETQDQTVAIANGDATFAANAWHQTGAFSADRTVAFGESLAVVIEFDGSGRQGSDQLTFMAAQMDGNADMHHCMNVHKSGAGPTWALSATMPNIILEFSDGTFGTLFGAFPCTDISFVLFNNTDTEDEYALEMTLPFPWQLDSAGVTTSMPDGADAELIVYDGTTPVTNGTSALVPKHSSSPSAVRHSVASFGAAIDVPANTLRRVALKPTTANDIRLYFFDVAAAGHMAVHPGGTDWVWTSRADGGSWAAPTATRRPFIWPCISGVDDGSGGGGASGGGPLVGGRLIQ